MLKQVFINLPVKDLEKSMSFYEAIGFTNNPQFTSKQIIDAKQSVGVSNALSFESIETMKTFAANAVKAGGREYASASDYGFMQQYFIEDLDGHNWEPFYMDMSKFPG